MSGGLTHLDPRGGASATGVDNLEIAVKYQLLRSEPHEGVASVALSWEVGGTGRTTTGADSFDRVSPAVVFGKGLGDRSEPFALLKPFALAGLLGLQLPVERRAPVLAWGVVLEYSLPYLEAFVTRIGRPPPLNRLVPLVELDMQTDLNRGAAGRVRGTVNPGVVWVSDVVQIGVEAVAPLDDRSGNGAGVRVFLRIPLDTIVGERFGRPVFAGQH